MKTILIATDGSPSARDAIHIGLDLAREHESEVMFVHVIDAPPDRPRSGPAGPLWDWPTPSDYGPLNQAAELAAGSSVAAETQLRAGDTVAEILSCADSIDADLIVVGSRGRGSIRAALLGSTSRGLIHETRRPVLVVHGKGVHETRPGAVQAG